MITSSCMHFMTFGTNSRDAVIVAFTNCATSVFAAIIIFAIMGFKVRINLLIIVSKNASQAHNSYEACLLANVTDVLCDLQEQLEKSASGTGLAFILFTGTFHHINIFNEFLNEFSEAVNQFPYANLWALLFFCMVSKKSV